MATVLPRNLIVTVFQQYNNYCTFCGIFVQCVCLMRVIRLVMLEALI